MRQGHWYNSSCPSLLSTPDLPYSKQQGSRCIGWCACPSRNKHRCGHDLCAFTAGILACDKDTGTTYFLLFPLVRPKKLCLSHSWRCQTYWLVCIAPSGHGRWSRHDLCALITTGTVAWLHIILSVSPYSMTSDCTATSPARAALGCSENCSGYIYRNRHLDACSTVTSAAQ